MTSRAMCTCALALALCCTAARAQSGAPAAGPRYARAIEQELSSLGISARCANEGSAAFRCSYPRASGSDRALEMQLVYSDRSDTIYIYVAHYLLLPPERTATPTVLRRLMELNWELLTGKFEWNPHTGEVRLSAVLSTDSNFDLRAFRSTLHGLEAVATRYDDELHALLR